MMRNRLIKVVLGVLLVGVVGGTLFGKEALFHFLAPNERVEASVLVVEGWISEEALQQVVDELQDYSYDQVVVTSVAHHSYYRMYQRGALIFKIAEDQETGDTAQTLQVRAFGVPAEGVQAHAQILVDTVPVGEMTVTDELTWYSFPIPHGRSIDSVTVVYDNDHRTKSEDRNLYVEAVKLDTLLLPARHPLVRYDRGKIDGERVLRTDYESVAEEAREFLIAQGVDSMRLQTLTADLVAYERTYASALAVKQYLADSVTSIMVLSETVHARRSRLVYRKVLGDSVKVGIRAAHSYDEQPEDWWKESGSRNYVLLQLAKYVYARFFFYPGLTDL